MDAIPAGVDFREFSRQELSHCRVVLVVIGRSWLTCTDASGTRRLDGESDHVRLEIVAALSGDAVVIPVLVDGATMPLARELPAEISALAFRNAVALRNDPDFRNDIARLTKTVKDQLRARADVSFARPDERVGADAHTVTSGGVVDIAAKTIGAWLLAQVTYSSDNWIAYAVTHAQTGRRAALSILRPRGGPLGRRADAILAAVEHVSEIDHPGIVSVLDWGRTDGRAYVVTGTDQRHLHDFVRATGPLDEVTVLRALASLADALAHLHSLGLVHQLVNPESVTVSEDGRNLLLDWPMYCVAVGSRDVDVDGKGQRAVVMRYAAPETFRDGGLIEAAVDIYGLGEVLHYALTGSEAFPQELPSLFVAKSRPAPPIREQAPRVSQPTARLHAALLAPDPADRPATSASVRDTCLRLVKRLGAGDV